MEPSIIFPNLGIELGYFPTGFKIFGLTINFYGVIIAVGMILSVILAVVLAKKTNQDTDNYFDVTIAVIIGGILGARIYYIIFSWDEFKGDILAMLNIRNGGLAIYGGIIGGLIAIFIVCRVKKISFIRIIDTVAFALPLGQAIGRWGNFFNREAFGEYTDGLFAMQIKYSEVGGVITDKMRENMVNINGVDYIQVAPTFLYESIWCLIVMIVMLAFRRYQRYNGETLLWYLGGYGLGRAYIEGLRTDSLYVWGTNIPVSQLLSIAMVAAALTILIINRVRLAKGWQPDFRLVMEDGEPGTKAYNEARKAARKAKKKSEWETYEVDDKKEETPKEETSEDKWVDLEDEPENKE